MRKTLMTKEYFRLLQLPAHQVFFKSGFRFLTQKKTKI
jgi:hypothetical protein